MKKLIFILLLFIHNTIKAQTYDVCIIGGGTSGIAAGIQSARLGAKTIIIEETPWLGGMLTSAGVSATDGNHDLPSGLWGEFRQKLYDYYGGAKDVQTGWVSNTQFEPHIGAQIFKEMAAKETNLTVSFNSKMMSIKKLEESSTPGVATKNTKKEDGNWQLKIKSKKGKKTIQARIVIDATEMGDVAKAVGVTYRIGTDDPTETGEVGYAAKKTDIVQDYHRESRRTEGLVTMTINHILKPFDQKEKLYRTGIAVGDYPIDHHHAQYQNDMPNLNFPPVPSFNVPLGALIPKKIDHFIVAEKSISVTNIVNGTTRLQPCVLLIGQAAGTLAALSALEKSTPRDMSIRRIQSVLLEKGAYLMPYYDVKPNHPHFLTIQRIGATGLLRGIGEPNKLANRTWFYPDSMIQNKDFLPPFDDFGFDIKDMTPQQANRNVSVREAVALAFAMMETKPDVTFEGFLDGVGRNWDTKLNLKNFQPDRSVTRLEIAVIFDRIAQPFDKAIDFKGFIKNSN